LLTTESLRLGLNDRLVEWVENAPAAWAGITVAQLLSHMAGLAHHFERTVDGVHLLEYSRDDMLASAKSTPMVAEPGTDWNYSDQGYFLLGVIIEEVTGQSYAEFMQSTFFGPLGMDQTHLLDQRRIVPHLAQGYAWQDGSLDSCDAFGYARGWQVVVVDGRRTLSHTGYAGTVYIRAVDTGLSVIVLTNREDTPEALSHISLGWEAAHIVDRAIPADGYRCWEQVSA